MNSLTAAMTRRCVISITSKRPPAVLTNDIIRSYSVSNHHPNPNQVHSKLPCNHQSANVLTLSPSLSAKNLIVSSTLTPGPTAIRWTMTPPSPSMRFMSQSSCFSTLPSGSTIQPYSLTNVYKNASSSSTSLLQHQTRSFASQKHKRIIKMAKGYRGRANRTYRAAIRRVEKGLQYSYRDRKVKKRNFRRLWIQRVNAGVRQHGMSYSRFIRGMQSVGKKKKGGSSEEEDSKGGGILLNRKVLADLASNEPFSFKAVVDVVKMKMGQITGSK